LRQHLTLGNTGRRVARDMFRRDKMKRLAGGDSDDVRNLK
jgi:hypothetical protein